MEILWFAIVAFMLTMYVVLDGFDLGAGALHLLIARTDQERRTILNAIGPVWDGNEVWLIAAGGTLYFAFPLLYASSFSGFYLPLMIVLWLLILRGVGIEFRHQIHHPLWVSFWDATFAFASFLLTIVLGAALGNIIRGVPLGPDGYFFTPLWTTFTIVPEAGVLDWYTVTMGLVSLFTLTVHGANYIAMKTGGDLQQRARGAAAAAWWGVVVTSIAALVPTLDLRPQILGSFENHPWGCIFPVLGIIGLIGAFVYNKKGNDLRAFLSSALFIAGMLSATAFGMFPTFLPATSDAKYTLTAYNTITHEYGLGVGIVWWLAGMVLAVGYFYFLFRSFKGKVAVPKEGEGY